MPSDLTTSGQWFFVRDGREVGPVTTDEIRRLVDSGELTPADLIVPEQGLPAGEMLRLSARSSPAWPETTDDIPTGRPAPFLDLPGYEILQEIGRGGMGVVYKARHVALDRIVAVKTLLSEQGHPGELERFLREARALARLHHPGIVQVFEVGEHASQPFFAMEFVPGGNLARQLARRPQRPTIAAHLVEALARAVHAAHSAGIVHRDLKPGNVLVTDDGTLKVTDFGLVKDLIDSEKRTQTGAILGTFEYMAPEQAQGDAARIGPHTDLYSLGVILYQALVGFTPFQGPPIAILHALAEKDPVPPSRLQPGVPRDLELVCLKCLEKDPARRYSSAADLADELARFQKNEPVKVRPLGPVGRGWRWCRRNRTVASLLALVFLTLLAGAGIAGFFAVAEAHTAELEREQRRKAEREETKSHRLAYASQVPLAFRLWQEGSIAQARQALAATRPELRGWEFAYLDWLFNTSQKTIRAHERGAFCVCFSPDGERLASTGSDGAVRTWDVRTGQLVFAFEGLPGGPRRVRFSPDGKILAATAAKDKSALVTLWDARTGRELYQLRGGGSASGLSFSRDSKRIAAGGSEKLVVVWDVASGAQLLELKGHEEMINAVDFSPDGKRLASVGQDRVVRVWDLDSRKQALSLSGHTSSVYDVCFSPDGHRILTTSGDESARVWNANTGREEVAFRGHKGSVECGCFGPAGKLAASAGSDDLIRVWEARTGRQVLALRGHEDRILGVAISPNGELVASASFDGTVKLWDAVRGQSTLTLDRHGDSVLGVSVSADGRRVVTAGWDCTARLWDAKTGRELLTLKGHTDGVYAATFGRDGKRVATGGADGTMRVWDADTGGELFASKGHAKPVASVDFAPAGEQIATAGEDGTVRHWDARTGGLLSKMTRPTPAGRLATGPLPFRSVRFSPDGRRLVTTSAGVPYKPPSNRRPGTSRDPVAEEDWLSLTSDDWSVRVWDVGTGEQVFALEGHASEVSSACFSPNGKRIASASADRTIKLWDANTGEEVATLRGHSAAVHAVCFSADGKRLASAGADRTLKVWDVESGQELIALKGHDGIVRAVCFSPDGRRLFTVGDDGIKVWGGDPFEVSANQRGVGHLSETNEP